jgi:hypothetical protein
MILEHTTLASRVFGVLVDVARVVKMTSAVSTMWDLGSRFDLDLVLHIARRCMSCVSHTKRHTGCRCRGPARALGMLTDLGSVEECVFDAIESRNQVARSGWVGFRQHIGFNKLVGGDCIALNDEEGGWSGGFCRHRAEADVDGIGEEVRHAFREDDVTW